MALEYAWIVPSWADQLLPQLLMEQFDTLLIQFRHIEHMHEGVWFGKKIVCTDSTEIFFSKLRSAGFRQNDSCENLEIFSLIRLLYMHRWCLHGPINSFYSF